MKINKRQLQKLIKEEIQRMIYENLEEPNTKNLEEEVREWLENETDASLYQHGNRGEFDLEDIINYIVEFVEYKQERGQDMPDAYE